MKNGDTRMMPNVDKAESAKEMESDVQGSIKRQTTMQRPKAFCDDALRFAKNEAHPSDDMNAARNAEMGKAQTKSKKPIVMNDATISFLLPTRRRERNAETKAIAKLK